MPCFSSSSSSSSSSSLFDRILSKNYAQMLRMYLFFDKIFWQKWRERGLISAEKKNGKKIRGKEFLRENKGEGQGGTMK